MKRILIVAYLLTVCYLAYNQSINPGPDEVYTAGEVALIELTMSESDKEALWFPENSYEDIYYLASMHFANSYLDETLDSVAIRIRGNTSRENIKKSLKIDFREFGSDKFHGYKKFNLKAGVNDPSMLREYISLQMYQAANIPVARAQHARVYINGEYMGLYLNVEQIDDEFLDKRFDSELGNLYKCYWGATFENNGEVNNNNRYELKTNEETNDRSKLINFVTVLNSYSGEDLKPLIEAIFDVETYLRQMAVETLIGHWDGYSFNSNNFYIHENPTTNKIDFIPYDLDNTFGIDWVGGDWGTRDVKQWGSDWINLPLNTKLLGIDSYFESYCRNMVTLCNTYFTHEYLDPILDENHTLIAPFVEEDLYYTYDRSYTYSDFQKTLDEARGDQVKYGVKEYIGVRNASALVQLEGYEPYDTTNNGGGTTTSISPLAESVLIFPNPVKEGYFFIKTSRPDASPVVYDQMGRQVKIEFYDLGNGEYRLSFNSLPQAGWYVLKIDSLAQKFIVR